MVEEMKGVKHMLYAQSIKKSLSDYLYQAFPIKMKTKSSRGYNTQDIKYVLNRQEPYKQQHNIKNKNNNNKSFHILPILKRIS